MGFIFSEKGLDIMFKIIEELKEKNKLRYFTNLVYGVLLTLFISFMIGLVGVFIGSGGDLNNMFIFGKRPTLIVTGSMEPAIAVNGLVILEPVEYEDIEVGDIIRYTSYRGFSILHRVIAKNVSYVVTKGDANAVQDMFVVTRDQITGRVVSIHNETAPVVTKIFGQISMDDWEHSFARFGLGFLMVGVFIFLSIVCFILIFEMITTVYFFKKYGRDLIHSSNYWVDKVKSRDEEVEVFENFFEKYKIANPIKKIILAYKLRRYYNGLCNIEKEVLKTEKRLETMNKWLDKNGHK